MEYSNDWQMKFLIRIVYEHNTSKRFTFSDRCASEAHGETSAPKEPTRSGNWKLRWVPLVYGHGWIIKCTNEIFVISARSRGFCVQNTYVKRGICNARFYVTSGNLSAGHLKYFFYSQDFHCHPELRSIITKWHCAACATHRAAINIYVIEWEKHRIRENAKKETGGKSQHDFQCWLSHIASLQNR